MTDDVKDLFKKSKLSEDPRHLNVYALILDHQGRLLHGFHGLSGRGEGRSDYKVEIARGLERLKLPEGKRPEQERSAALPDLKPTTAGVPAGVRIFVRPVGNNGTFDGRKPVVEVVPVKADEWKTLAFPEKAKEIDAEKLREWLVQVYPPAIRTVDQMKPFQKVEGKLKLEPAGGDKKVRYALLSGDVRLNKGDDKESALEATLQVVLTYLPDAPHVQSVRGVVEGDYLYRMRGTQRIPLKVAIESRPE
ncbi:MAG TPA: hypothetical protein VKD71_12395 [Gemmataceae bacterium]|nr:hypothetical protein [Gemmataceae bacterium]